MCGGLFCWVKGWFKKCRYHKGKIILAAGSHKVTIGTCKDVCAVYLDVQEPCGGVTCCIGDLNTVVSSLDTVNHEFTICAEIKTTSCTITYIAEHC